MNSFIKTNNIMNITYRQLIIYYRVMTTGLSKFKENESYKHKAAKEVLKEWFYGGGKLGDIGFEPNRPCGVFLEYPIVKNERYDSVAWNWDEQLKNPKTPSGDWDEYVPTYEDCVELGIYPKRVVDVVFTHKGSPYWFIEICHTNPTSREKIEELQSLGVCNLIEIDADWILNQTKIPTRLIYKTLIDRRGNILQHGQIISAKNQSRIYLKVSFDDKDAWCYMG